MIAIRMLSKMRETTKENVTYRSFERTKYSEDIVSISGSNMAELSPKTSLSCY